MESIKGYSARHEPDTKRAPSVTFSKKMVFTVEIFPVRFDESMATRRGFNKRSFAV
jgi:hypothetical protein